MRVDPQRVVAGLQAGEAALQQVDGAGHRAQVDALGGGAALDVGDVALQRLEEVVQRLVAVRRGPAPRRARRR